MKSDLRTLLLYKYWIGIRYALVLCVDEIQFLYSETSAINRALQPEDLFRHSFLSHTARITMHAVSAVIVLRISSLRNISIREVEP